MTYPPAIAAPALDPSGNRSGPSSAGRVGVLILSVATVAVLVAFGPIVAAGALAAVLLSAALVVSGRRLPLVVLPLCVLAPHNLRFRLATLPDITLTRVVVLLCLLQVVADHTRHSDDRPVLDPLLRWSMVAFATVIALNVLLVAGASGVNRGLNMTVEFLLPAWLVFRAVRTRDDIRTVIRTLLWAAVLASVMGIVEFALHRVLLPEALQLGRVVSSRAGLVRVQGLFFPHSIVFGIFLDMILPLALCCAASKAWGRTLGRVAAVLAVPALLFTLSRGPWFAALVAVAGLVVFAGGRRATAFAGVSVMAVALVVASPLGGTVSTVLSRLDANPQLGQPSTEVLYRQRLLATAIDFGRSHPFGGGLGAISQLHLGTSIRGDRIDFSESVDNDYAILVFEIGPVGLLVFLGVLARVVVLAFAIRRRSLPDSDDRLLAAALAASLLSLLFVGITVATFIWYQISLFASCLVGLVAALHRVTNDPTPTSPATR